MIAASGGVEIKVVAEICQKVVDRFGMLSEWVSIVVPIIKGKGDIRNCVEKCLLMKCYLALCFREEQLMLYLF